MSKITAAITATGAYLPETILTNAMLENMVETNDEWITTRTGIKERRILKITANSRALIPKGIPEDPNFSFPVFSYSFSLSCVFSSLISSIYSIDSSPSSSLGN